LGAEKRSIITAVVGVQ
jgi:ribosomal protein L12E/L44/L45/RPP1/RPP2